MQLMMMTQGATTSPTDTASYRSPVQGSLPPQFTFSPLSSNAPSYNTSYAVDPSLMRSPPAPSASGTSNMPNPEDVQTANMMQQQMFAYQMALMQAQAEATESGVQDEREIDDRDDAEDDLDEPVHKKSKKAGAGPSTKKTRKR